MRTVIAIITLRLTVLDVPLIQLSRERALKLLNVRLDATRVGVVLRRVHRLLMAKRRKASEISVPLCESESFVCKPVPPCTR